MRKRKDTSVTPISPRSDEFPVIDHRSGFRVSSKDAVWDDYNVLASKDNADSLHPSEMPVYSRTEYKLPFTRPEGEDTFVEGADTVVDYGV